MADDTTAIQQSLDEIKNLLNSKKKENAIGVDVFTDPRFIEVFEKFFHPLIDAAEDIEEKLKEKKSYSVFDIIGLDQKKQDAKRKQIVEQIDKISDKIKTIGKNLTIHKNYIRTEILGITDARRDYHQRVIRRAVDNFAFNLNKAAKVLGDPAALIKVIGLKPLHVRKTVRGVDPAKIVVVDPSGAPAPGASKPIPTTPPESLAEKTEREKHKVRVVLVDITDEAAKKLSELRIGTADREAPKKDEEHEREQYSRAANRIARMLTLAGGLLFAGINALFKGMFDDGPLKGMSKIIGRYTTELAAVFIKGAIPYLSKFVKMFGAKMLDFIKLMPDWMLRLGKATIEMGKSMFTKLFSKEAPTVVAKVASSSVLKTVGKTTAKWLLKILKKVPVIGLLISVGYAAHRFMNGDYVGGLIDLASGLVSIVPVVGTAVAIILDIWNAKRDLESGGVKNLAGKGWNKKFTDFLADKFKKLIYGAIKHIPFAADFARMVGLGDMVDDAEREEASANTNQKFSDAAIGVNITRNKSAGRMKQILGDRSINQLSPEELKEYEHHRGIVERADVFLEKARARARGVSTDAEQSAASVEADQVTEGSYQEDVPPITVSANTPFDEASMIVAENSDETVDILKSIDGRLKDQTTQTAQAAQATIGGTETGFNVSTSITGGSTQPSLLSVITTSRDTCYNNREAVREMLLNYRAYA